MKFQYASDLHLEFSQNLNFLKKSPIVPVADYLLLAGDILPFVMIDRYRAFFDYLADHFLAVYWIPGNHEYYHFDIEDRCGSFREKIRENVFLLNDTSLEIAGCQLIFSTLWSQISALKEPYISSGMPDFHLISAAGKLFSSRRYNQLHQNSRSFIAHALANSGCEQKIVVSHHVPTFQYYPPEYLGSPLNEAFASDLDHLIIENAPHFWIYGHHHRNIGDFQIGRTSMRTNQLGYVHQGEQQGFVAGKLLL